METVQSLHAIQTGQLLNLSLPQVLDCFGNTLFDDAFVQLTLIAGLCLEKSYPRQKHQCVAGECPVAAPVTSAGGSMGLQKMEAAIQKIPLLVFVDGRLESFKSYTGGIYDDPNCSSSWVTKAIQVVGYGTENGKDFWICKNNWGTGWGENGYMRIAKGVNRCAVEEMAQYPI